MLAVGFCRRSQPSVGELRQRLRDGRLGKVVGMVAQHTTSTQSFIPADNWRADPDEARAGAMTAVGLHALDLMIEFGGRVHDVQCVTAPRRWRMRRHHHVADAIRRRHHRRDLLLGGDCN
jgi:predicted dehydrogenase